MQHAARQWRGSAQQPRPAHLGLWVAGAIVASGVGAILLPFIPIVLGTLVLLAVGIHVSQPSMRPYTRPILRAPIINTGGLAYHVPVAAAVGVLLVVSGTLGATMRGRIFSEWKQHSQRQDATEEKVDELLGRALESIEKGDVDSAQYFLMSIDAGDADDAGKSGEVQELLARIDRCNDTEVILGILVDLSDEELAALESRTSIPLPLDFGQPALTYRAVDVAFTLLDEARRIRAQR